eukprot:5715383-Alexandrium_andersonii.AAC.1
MTTSKVPPNSARYELSTDARNVAAVRPAPNLAGMDCENAADGMKTAGNVCGMQLCANKRPHAGQQH